MSRWKALGMVAFMAAVVGVMGYRSNQPEGFETKRESGSARDLVVEFLTSLAQEHPFLLLASAVIGFMWLGRSALHELRLFVQHATKEVREFRLEVHEGATDLRALWQAFQLRPQNERPKVPVDDT